MIITRKSSVWSQPSGQSRFSYPADGQPIAITVEQHGVIKHANVARVLSTPTSTETLFFQFPSSSMALHSYRTDFKEISTSISQRACWNSSCFNCFSKSIFRDSWSFHLNYWCLVKGEPASLLPRNDVTRSFHFFLRMSKYVCVSSNIWR